MASGVQKTAESSFKIQRANHIGFTVASMQDALEFWVGVLGFTAEQSMSVSGDLLEQPTGVPGAAAAVVLVHGPGLNIELFEYTGPQNRKQFMPRSCDIGSVHLCFETDNIDAALEASARVGWHTLGTTQAVPAGSQHGLRIMTVRSPEGISVEFYQLP